MKDALRKKILKLRRDLPDKIVEDRSRRIFHNLCSLQEYEKAENIMVYIDFRKEVKTKYIIEDCLNKNKNVIVPISKKDTRELMLSKLVSHEDLVNSTYGILEPKKEKIIPVSPDILDLIIVPGVVFDKLGYRIGYGAGYYDRFLSQLKHDFTTVGLSFELQLRDKAPRDAHDYQLDFIITEKRIIKTKKEEI